MNGRSRDICGAQEVLIRLLGRDNEVSRPRSALCCHPERSEGSDAPGTEILRYAQDDRTGCDGEKS
jgi:hypothetical protein